MDRGKFGAAAAITAALGVVWAGGVACAEDKPDFQAWWRAYESAGFVKTPDGRGLRLYCMGSGAPAVVFEAGLGASGSSFRFVQPSIAKTTRACVYDRAGYGRSDEARDARDLKALSADLAVVVKAAGRGGPVVLAGHSFGGPITRFFAATHPKLVAGLALIDPAGDDQRRRLAEAAPSYGATSNFDPAIAGRKCVALIEKDPIPEGTADYKSCMGDWPPADIPPELKAAVVRERGASFQRAQLAEAEGLKAGGSVAQEGGAVRRSLGDIPLIVLTRGLRSAPPDVSPSEKEAYIGVWQRMHWEDAGLSTHGRRRFVEGATHYVQRDKPEAVITAVKEVVAEARSRGR